MRAPTSEAAVSPTARRRRTTAAACSPTCSATCGQLGKPVIARVRGYALAGGFGLACACDLDRRVRRLRVRHARDQRGPVAVHDHGAVAAVDATQDRARSDDDRAAGRGRGGCAHRFRAAGRSRRPSSMQPSTRSRPSSRRSRRSSCVGVATRSTGCSRWTPTPRSSYLQGMLTITVADRGRGRGCRRVRGEARAAVEGTLAMADPRHDWGPLVGDLARAQGPRARDGWREARRAPAVARQAHGARATRSASSMPGTWVEYGLLADHMDAGPRRPFPRRRRRGHGRRRDRRPARRGRRVRLHRDGRARWARSARTRSHACARMPCASASRSCGCSIPPARASSRRAVRASRARARCSASRSR